MDKRELFSRGKAMLVHFQDVHPDIVPVTIVEDDTIQDTFGVCGYYRHNVIHIDIKACAAIGTAGRQWSFPGYVVDRTPFGVLAHEMGHHVDVAHGAVPGHLSPSARAECQEEAITGYHPNTNEWFAEMFRLWLTNPDLLQKIRPRICHWLDQRLRRIENRPWDQIVMAERQRGAARNKIEEARKKREREKKMAPAQGRLL